MTGTSSTEADEFQDIYGLEVIDIPTNVPLRVLMMTMKFTALRWKNINPSWCSWMSVIKQVSPHLSAQPRLKNLNKLAEL